MLKHLKRFDSRLFVALLITGLLPVLYVTVRFNFLGNLPTDWGYNIASQLQYIHLMFEVLQEMLILPLFFIIGKTINDSLATKNKVNTGLLGLFGIFTLFSLIVGLSANWIVQAMAQNPDLIAQTVSYIRYELIGLVFSNLVKFLLILFILKNYKKEIYFILIVQMFLTIFFDSLFISELSISMNVGVNGIAYTNIIVNIALLGMMLGLTIKKLDITKTDITNKLDFHWFREWVIIGGFSGIESFVRNFAFMIMIIRMINVVNEQGTFWVANGFIWGWMLLPILTLGELIKKETSEGDEQIRTKTYGYFLVTTIVMILWLVTIPFWPWFLRVIMNITEYQKVFNLITLQIIFYAIFAYNNIMDSTFYGVGKTNYMLYQSLIVNIMFYGAAFIFFKLGIFIPTLNGIALLFGLGMVFDFIPTTWLYMKLLRDREIKLELN
jgi:Na+-driven multidrug efflux pump